MTSTLFPPTRDAGLERLAAFVPRAGRHYAANRNHDFGPGDRSNISLLSPYVRHRLITEQEIVAAVLEQHAAAVADKFIQEVVWRTYWKGWLEQRPHVWARYVTDVALLRETASTELRQRLATAESCQTGVDCFDAWARELIETGYLHNHARMWFASLWIFTLKLPWQLGADFFLRHLLDGDAASNTLSWRWVAGLHTQGKTYLARADNIAAFTQGRFNPGTQLATAADPLPWDDPGPRHALVPAPSSVPRGAHVLVVTDDDLGFETWAHEWADVTAVLLLDTANGLQGTSTAVAAFKRGAGADTATRLRHVVPSGVAIAKLTVPQIIATVDSFQPNTTVVMHEMPMGPSRIAFAPLRHALAERGHVLHTLRRPWDAAFWPHATAGFFKVKDKIPGVVRALGLAA